MRLTRLSFFAVLSAALLGGCPAETLLPSGSALVPIGGDDLVPASAQPMDTAFPHFVTGSVSNGDYRMFTIGPTAPGEAWSISAAPQFDSQRTFLLVLFDEQHNLLYRRNVTAGGGFDHVVRSNTAGLVLGVAPAFGGIGGDFRFQINRTGTSAVPGTEPQIVYLNFGDTSNLTVHRRDGISFPAFDAGMLGAAYASETESVKNLILSEMTEDYADYDLVIVSSDLGPAPEGAHATIHFGGYDERLLGLADSVDQYNEDSGQHAIIYVESFADYEAMNLSTEEMAQMVANVASHELGHLVGLYHTAAPVDVMDTTGSVYDLIGDQSFTRGPLEETVFPTGYENSPARLAETIGLAPAAKSTVAKRSLEPEEALRKAELRAIVRRELVHGCGTCLSLDDE